jgi:hypothetical protein
LLRVLYNRDFFRARITAYAVITVYVILLMFFDPFEYACSDANPCLGCGFRTGIWLLLEGHIQEGLSSNSLVAPAAVAALVTVIDLLIGATRWAAKSRR